MMEILLVDDEPELLEIVGAALKAHGHRVALASDGAAALEAARRHRFDAVVCDVRMPEVDGLTVLKRLRSQCPQTPVILMTANGQVNEAVTAIHGGAFDYLTKPFEMRELLARLGRIGPSHDAPTGLAAAPPVPRRPAPSDLLGDSAAMVKLRELIDKFAASDAPVLIHGESGTGKELVSHLLHDKSTRREHPFIAVNCAAFPETLLEAELFGHERGAFTGAVRKREGRFLAANGGTLLLDEVAELPLTSQPKLLRVLQEQLFEPLGTNQSVRVDVRLLSATHRSLRDQLGLGRFREDLYYRLKILELEVPPLRERTGDVTLLVQQFLKRFGNATSPTRISPEAFAALNDYPFPGNVRELEHAIRHATVIAAGESELRLEHLPPDIATVRGDPTGVRMLPLHEAAFLYERAYLVRALALNTGRKGATALLLGISRKNLWEKLRRHGIVNGEVDPEPSTGETELPR